MKLLLALAAATTFSVGASSAATLDFTTLGSGTIGSATASVPGADLTSEGGQFFVGAGAGGNTICALTDAFNCQSDLTIDFLNIVSNLSFVVSGFDLGDFVSLTVSNSLGASIATIEILADGLVDLTAFSGIGSLFFDDASIGAGYAYGDFNFDVGTATIPLPATLPLLLAGLGAAGLIGRRRKA